MQLYEILKAYKEWVIDSPISRTTQRNYYYHSTSVANWLADRLRRQPTSEDINSTNLRAYFDIKGRQVAPGTLYQYDAMLRNLCAWMQEKGHIESDPMLRIARPKNARGKRIVPSKEVIAALPSAPDKIYDPYRRLLARAVLSVMMDCGLRPGEVRSLLLNDYDRAAKTLTIRLAKGGKGRVIYLPKKTVESLNAFIAARPKGCRSPGLFAIDKGRSLGVGGLPNLLGELLHLAGHRREEAGRVTPHAMRHVAATKLMQSGANLRELQEIFGWASVQMAMTYVEISPEDTRNALERATAPPAPVEATPLAQRTSRRVDRTRRRVALRR